MAKVFWLNTPEGRREFDQFRLKYQEEALDSFISEVVDFVQAQAAKRREAALEKFQDFRTFVADISHTNATNNII